MLIYSWGCFCNFGMNLAVKLCLNVYSFHNRSAYKAVQTITFGWGKKSIVAFLQDSTQPQPVMCTPLQWCSHYNIRQCWSVNIFTLSVDSPFNARTGPSCVLKLPGRYTCEQHSFEEEQRFTIPKDLLAIHFLTMSPYISYSASLNLHFFIGKMRIIIIYTSHFCCEN